MKNLRVAIDGPASAGKSTIAKILAKKLHLIYCDTGAMYRSATYGIQEAGIAAADEEKVMDFLKSHPITFQLIDGVQHVFLGEKDVTAKIRSQAVSAEVSAVSALPRVRELLVAWQQRIAQHGNIVMDGRDIGTVVLPDAEVKIYLVASVEERAERRYKEMIDQGHSVDFTAIKKGIEDRDHYDSTRKTSPLKQAHDAVLVDTTGLSIECVVNEIIKIIQQKAGFFE
ncbi:MAG: (d)CMP kinase [Enterococcaceae bacterium]|nr:(d)CMP kinase [Enterococcaceae bacterium]MCI1919745.1 (d)CMP kinase [Enterococcaceae bacterium]